jgi:hypothetical protein
MKEWFIELTQNTIISAAITLLWYVLGIDKSWEDAANTFGTAFLVLTVLSLWKRLKKKN